MREKEKRAKREDGEEGKEGECIGNKSVRR